MDSQANQALIELKLIDQLIIKRKLLIDTFCQAVELQVKAMKIADEINQDIPTVNSGYIDDFSSIFIQLASALGESSRGRSLPRNGNLVRLSEKELKALVIKTVDSSLWVLVFNRLGIFGSMSQLQITQFTKQCKDNTLPFDREHIEGTLRNLFDNQESMLLESLLDTIQEFSTAYVNNNRQQFTKKIIIENAFNPYGESYKLSAHEGLQSLLTLIWRWVLVNRTVIDTDGVKQSGLWRSLEERVQNSKGDLEELNSITLLGIEFRFFKKRTLHVLLPESMISILNDRLASSRMLPSV